MLVLPEFTLLVALCYCEHMTNNRVTHSSLETDLRFHVALGFLFYILQHLRTSHVNKKNLTNFKGQRTGKTY
jgi:hypothetical protein